MTELKTAIEIFTQADDARKVAIEDLDKLVSEEMQRRQTVAELHELIDMLPVSYPGIRRVYEAIERALTPSPDRPGMIALKPGDCVRCGDVYVDGLGTTHVVDQRGIVLGQFVGGYKILSSHTRSWFRLKDNSASPPA